jgi:hypothetical protein
LGDGRLILNHKGHYGHEGKTKGLKSFPLVYFVYFVFKNLCFLYNAKFRTAGSRIVLSLFVRGHN